MKVSIYVEGGGDTTATQSRCRKGFSQFILKMLPDKDQPKIVACGGRGATFDDFQQALSSRQADQAVLLLVDSEGPVDPSHRPWEHLKARTGDGWDKPSEAGDRDAHLMVQNMEAWFLADPSKLVEKYGKGFKLERLPSPTNGDIETIGKDKIKSGLKMAIRATKIKEYDKGTDSFEILAKLDPQLVCAASEHARRLRKVLTELLPDRR